jgi:hypothetical protein
MRQQAKKMNVATWEKSVKTIKQHRWQQQEGKEQEKKERLSCRG